jgi:pyruvate/2-oxoglutarate dehydrogenase complex dihydrolipoamide acyltransferase (E2) component
VRYAVVDLILAVAVSTGGVVTVEALIADFLRPSGASEAVTWTCEQCNFVHNYQPTFSIGPAFAPAQAPDPNAAPAAPPLLFVEFGRVTGGLGFKSLREVDLAETIIVPITGADGVSRPVAYKLLWVLVHTAETSGAGHYVLFVLVGGRWWSIDDLDRHSRPRPWPSLGAVLFGDFTKFAVSQLVAAAGYERIPGAAAAAEPALRHGDSAAAATASPPTTAPATATDAPAEEKAASPTAAAPSLDAPTAAATPPSAAAATPTPTPTVSAPAELASEVRSAFPSPHTCAHPHT